jgi:Transcriptional regulator LmrA/YxaF-like, C-terminal domain
VFESWLVGLDAILESAGVPAVSARPLAQVILSALEGAFVLARAARRTEALKACGEAMATLVADHIAKAAAVEARSGGAT